MIGLAVVAAVLGLVLVFGRKDFVIRVRSGRVECRGRLSLVQQKALAEFLLHGLVPRGPITILGRREGDRLRLWFRGPLTPGERQRIRNFLLTHR